jgi:rRNA biogenesis protein RRP5
MCKKFKDDVKVWLEYGRFKFTTGKPHEAREVLSKSLKSLPKTSHLEMISQFALLEYKFEWARRFKNELPMA